MKYAIVLAAGIGSRMNSNLNKVMHKVVDKPIIGHIVDNLKKTNVDHIEVVVGYQQEQIREYLKDSVSYSVQEKPLGTGDAVRHVTHLQDKEGKTLVLVGDIPLIQPETLEALFEESKDSDCVILSAKVGDPSGYGRIIRNNLGEVKAIIEAKECSDEQKIIDEINTGVIIFDNQKLWENLPELQNENPRGEYYLTQLVELFKQKGYSVKTLRVNDPVEVTGINDRVQLSTANKWLQEKINIKWMQAGVTFIDPSSTYISMDAHLENDVTIYPNVLIKGTSVIKSGAVILPNSWIENSEIGHHTTIDSSRIVDSIVRDQVTIGPFSHLRMGSVVDNDNRIGNFVELKNTHMKADSRCAHLTYLGDAEIGEDVNIGCGVVTVNYDGKNKFRTVVGDGAFIGSNSNLIAPIHIGKKAVVAAGSTISNDVSDGDMIIERSQAVIKEGKGLTYINKPKLEKGK